MNSSRIHKERHSSPACTSVARGDKSRASAQRAAQPMAEGHDFSQIATRTQTSRTIPLQLGFATARQPKASRATAATYLGGKPQRPGAARSSQWGQAPRKSMETRRGDEERIAPGRKRLSAGGAVAGALIGGAAGAGLGFLIGGPIGAVAGGVLGAVAGGLIGHAVSGSSAATPSLALANDSYTDTATESRKNIRFNVTVPSGLAAGDYALVNWVKGHMKDGSGNFFRVQMYGADVDANFSDFQVDSVDPDPVYWSDSSARWNYSAVSGGFFATDSPGPALSSETGAEYALNFRIGLYRLADVPTTTTGSMSASAIQILPWQYSVKISAAGAFTHPSL